MLGRHFRKGHDGDLSKILQTKITTKRLQVLSALEVAAEVGTGTVLLPSSSSSSSSIVDAAAVSSLVAEQQQQQQRGGDRGKGTLPPLAGKLDALSELLSSASSRREFM